MGIIRAISDSISGTFSDQWKEVITVGVFEEKVVLAPGILKSKNRNNGAANNGTENVISNKSIIYVPENTVAFIFSQSAIENIIDSPGGYEYLDGQKSVFAGDNVGKALLKQMIDRVGFAGITPEEKRVAFINLREIKGIRFGTKGPQVYNDLFYGADLEILAYGSFSLRVSDPEKFIKNFVQPNATFYSFDDPSVREKILPEFIQSFKLSLNSLSKNYRISELPSQSNEISKTVINDKLNVGSWKDRFGIEVTNVAVENIEFSTESRELVKQFSSNKMNIKAYDDVTQKTSDIAAQQKIAEGIQSNGLGDGGGMIFGMNIAQNLSSNSQTTNQLSIDQQIDAVKKLKEFLDNGILSQEEFETKKREIMGL